MSGWYADIDADWGWQPVLDSDLTVSMQIGFPTKAECETFIRERIIGQGMYDDE